MWKRGQPEAGFGGVLEVRAEVGEVHKGHAERSRRWGWPVRGLRNKGVSCCWV